jgi:aldose 1-epimerase
MVSFFYLHNDFVKLTISNYGASIISIAVKDKFGNWVDVVVGPDTTEKQLMPTSKYYGSTIGRYANRIAEGAFILNDKQYKLEKNNGSNCLHGGDNGFDTKIWKLISQTNNQIELNYISEVGEGGFPSQVNTTVLYSLTEKIVQIDYSAIADDDTVFNITNHTFFNLNRSGTILEHTLQVNAESFLPINENGIPLGGFENVNGTVFDFASFKTIGENINDDDVQLKNGNGYDHSFVLDNIKTKALTKAATAIGDISGIELTVFTTEPSVHLYTGNFMEAKNIFKNNTTDERRTAFCLETQHFPDSPNQKNFPSTVLIKGELFSSTTQYKFS